jgi:tartrate dehydratase beta subunit/fumarate hydratase class I family protein
MNSTFSLCGEGWGWLKNIFHLMFITMVTLEGLNVEKLGVKFISMDCDGNNVFQNVKVNVTKQIKENVA